MEITRIWITSPLPKSAVNPGTRSSSATKYPASFIEGTGFGNREQRTRSVSSLQFEFCATRGGEEDGYVTRNWLRVAVVLSFAPSLPLRSTRFDYSALRLVYFVAERLR